jgi:hypothetical protein
LSRVFSPRHFAYFAKCRGLKTRTPPQRSTPSQSLPASPRSTHT